MKNEIEKWINAIRTDINMMAGNVDNKESFERMKDNALTDLSWLEYELSCDC